MTAFCRNLLSPDGDPSGDHHITEPSIGQKHITSMRWSETGASGARKRD